MDGIWWHKKEATGNNKHETKPGRVTVPDHGQHKDLAKGTENSILKQAGLK